MGWALLVIYGAFIEVVLPLAAVGIILFRAVEHIRSRRNGN